MTLFRPKRAFEEVENVGRGRAQVASGFAPRRRGRNRRGVNPAGLLDGLDPLVGAYIDPWSELADGLKYPDAFRGLSGTFSSTFEVPIRSDPTVGGYTDLNMIGVTPDPGSALFCITADPSNIMIQGVSGANAGGAFTGSSSFNWPNGVLYTGAAGSFNAFGPGTGILGVDNTMPNLQDLRQLSSALRCVVGGLRFNSTMNFASVSGTVHMAPVFINYSTMTSFSTTPHTTSSEIRNGWQPALPSHFTDLINLPGYVEFPFSSLESDEMIAVFRRYGEEALAFKPAATAWGMDDAASGTLVTRYGDANIPDGIGHYAVVVFVNNVLNSTGGPLPALTPMGQLQVKVHYEYQPNNNSSLLTNASGPFCTPSPQFQPILMAAAANIAADIPVIRCVDAAGVEEGEFIGEVVKVWRSAQKIAGAVVSTVSTVAGALALFAL